MNIEQRMQELQVIGLYVRGLGPLLLTAKTEQEREQIKGRMFTLRDLQQRLGAELSQFTIEQNGGKPEELVGLAKAHREEAKEVAA